MQVLYGQKKENNLHIKNITEQYGKTNFEWIVDPEVDLKF